MVMSLERFNDKNVSDFFAIVTYKRMVNVVLALSEIEKGTFSEIAHCFSEHRLYIAPASLRKTLTIAQRELIVERKQDKYELTDLGNILVKKIEEVLEIL